MRGFLLIFCAFAIHGFSTEEPSRHGQWLVSCSNETCTDACENPIDAAELNNLPRVHENATANVSLHCTGVNFLLLKHNFGTYVVEQSTSESTWGAGKMSCGRFSTFSNLTAGTPYRYRLRRLTVNGLSEPEISEWFTTYAKDYRPKPVKNITYAKVQSNETNLCNLHTKITFEPADDRSCNYEIVKWEGRHALQPVLLESYKVFHFDMENLAYDQNVTVVIVSTNGNTLSSEKRTLEFTTPTCAEFHNNSNICVPEEVNGLRVKVTRVDRAFHDILVQWDGLEIEPDNYTVWIESGVDAEAYHRTVPGNVTELFFSNVKLTSSYQISVSATSACGESKESSIERNIEATPEAERFYLWIIGVPLLIAVAVFVYTFLQWRRWKSKQFSSRYSHFEILSQKDFSPNIKKLVKDDHGIEKGNTFLPREKFELNPEMLILKNVIGSGAYGIVRLGSLKNDLGVSTDVAVKMLQENPSMEDIENFHREISVMKSAGQHPNIVSLIGHCTLYNKPLLVVEYCCKGDLQTYLRTIWNNLMNVVFDRRDQCKCNTGPYNGSITDHIYTNGNSELVCQEICIMSNRLYDIHQDVLKTTENITAADLLNFGRQIATGMEFLSSNRIVHRDLAARNVLLCADKIVKISDFGLSRDVYQENVYRKQGNGKLPLKWMAIEALTHQVYTTFSDVWSFGILLWEIVTLGAIPYPGIPANRILKLLKSGYRLERPPNCGTELYTIMHSCWNTRPQSRPTFTELKQNLDKLLCNYSENKYLNLSDISEGPDNEWRLLSDTKI